MGLSFLTANHLNHSLLIATCDWHPARGNNLYSLWCGQCGVADRSLAVAN